MGIHNFRPEALALVESIVNLDAERAQICGVGVTCPF
jgi:hypothetical protein